MEYSPFENYYDDDEQLDDSKDTKETKKSKKRSVLETAPKSRDKLRETKERRLDLSSLLEQQSIEAKPASEHDPLSGSETTDDVGAEQGIEEISEEELQVVSRQILEEHDMQLKEALDAAEPNSIEEAEALSGAHFIDRLTDSVNDGEILDDDLLDRVTDEVASDLDVKLPEFTPSGKSLVDGSAEIASENEEDAGTPVHASTSPPGTSAASSSASSPASTPLGPSSGSSSVSPRPPAGGSPPPPSGPRLPAGRPGGGGSGSASHPPAGPLAGAGVMYRPPAPAMSMGLPERRRHRGADLLVGGIVGYLIGRRRGRIKTEARLMPVQKSLEKQVRDLNQKITIREKTIQSMVAEKAAREGEAVQQKIRDKVEAKARAKADRRQQNLQDARSQPAIELSRSAVLDDLPSSQVERPSSVHRHEKIAGAVISHTEVRPSVTREAVGRMSDIELLKVAAKVEVDGQSAKQLYERGQLSKEDVRAIVTEQLIGQGRAERLLRERRRPIELRTGTHEQITKQQDVPAAVVPGAPDGPVGHAATAASTTRVADVSAASDAVIAQHTLQERAPERNPYTYVWIVLGVTAALFLLRLFLF